MTKIQNHIVVEEAGGAYHNFFWVPGSCASLAWYISHFWTVVFIKDEGNRAVIILEKDA